MQALASTLINLLVALIALFTFLIILNKFFNIVTIEEVNLIDLRTRVENLEKILDKDNQ